MQTNQKYQLLAITILAAWVTGIFVIPKLLRPQLAYIAGSVIMFFVLELVYTKLQSEILEEGVENK